MEQSVVEEIYRLLYAEELKRGMVTYENAYKACQEAFDRGYKLGQMVGKQGGQQNELQKED